MKSQSVPNCRSWSAPVCVSGLYAGAPARMGSPCRSSTCTLYPGGTWCLSSVLRATSVKLSGAEPSPLALGPASAPIVPQPNRPKAPPAAMPFSTVRRALTSTIPGCVDGLTATPSCSSKWSLFMSVRLYACLLDELRVVLKLAIDHRLEFGDAERERIGAELGDALTDLRRLHERVDLLRQALDDRARRLRRHQRA